MLHNSKSLAEKFERGALYIFGEVMTCIYRINDFVIQNDMLRKWLLQESKY